MRNVTFAALVGTALACSQTSVADTPAAAAIEFSIEQQSLRDALHVFASQAGVQILRRDEEVSLEGMMAPPVVGALSAEEALKKLLSSTGLSYEFINERAVRIYRSRTVEGASNEQGQQDIGAVSRNAASVMLEEIVVTGSHIRGAAPVGAKLLTITRDDIDRSGYGRVEDVMEALPQNFTGISEDFNQSAVANQNYGTEIQLRGLGPGTTLTLVNGQRQTGGGTLGAFTDIASIPTSAIERIEILPDGASAIYGSDAIGGVVNIVLRKDYEGAETRVRYGSSGGDAQDLQLAQLFGTSWSSGHALLGYQYSQRDPLLYGDREYLASSGDQRARGGTDWRRSSPTRRGGAAGNIVCPSGVSTCISGEPAFAIPTGQDGTNLSVADLLPGEINYRDISYSTVLPEQEMHSAFLSASQAIGDRVELFANARYATRDSTFITSANGFLASVPSTNPFYVNPFGGSGPVRVEYDFTNLIGPPTSFGNTETVTMQLGSTVELTDRWRLSLSAANAREATSWRRINRLNSAAIPAALARTDPLTALNLFGDGSGNNPDTIESLRLPEDNEEATSKTWSASVIADGPIFALPGGDARLAVGADYRDEQLDVVSNFNLDGTTSNGRTDLGVFAELSLPLLDTLELSLAGRHDEYNDFGTRFNPKAGLRWTPWTFLGLRGSWGTSFRAPPFYLTNPQVNEAFTIPLNVADPTSSTGTTPTLSIYGVTPGLKEETATIWTVGLDLAPMEALSISLSYFDIDYRDKIQMPVTPLATEDRYEGTGIVLRNPTQQQIAEICDSPTFRGDCNFSARAIVDMRLRNLAVVNVSGLDLDSHYTLDSDIGQWRFRLGGTYTFAYEQAVTEISPLADLVDTFNLPLSLRLQGSVSWNRAAWNANVAVNYANSYEQPGTVALRTIDSWTTVNLSAGYRFGDGASWLAGMRLLLSATNVFDEEPPFADDARGYDTANASSVGRTLSVQVVKAW